VLRADISGGSEWRTAEPKPS